MDCNQIEVSELWCVIKSLYVLDHEIARCRPMNIEEIMVELVDEIENL